MRTFCNLTFFIIFVALFVAGIFEAISNFNSNLPYSFLPNGVSFHVGHKIVSINNQITPQQKQQAQQL